MYLHGLGDCNPVWEDCVASGPSVAADATDASNQWPNVSNPAGSDSFSWLGDVLNTGIKAFTSYKGAELQSQTAIATAPYTSPYRYSYPPGTHVTGSFPGYTQYPSGAGFSSNMTTWLLIGGVTLAAIMLMGGKQK